ncbi:hypothetical protein [Kitasatospora sp. NBC_00315]
MATPPAAAPGTAPPGNGTAGPVTGTALPLDGGSPAVLPEVNVR